MKNHLIMKGHSDDIVVAAGCIGANEYYPNYNKPAVFLLSGVLWVIWRYTNGGCWSVELGQVDEELSIPDNWEISVYPEGYSMVLEVKSEHPLSITQVE